MRGLAKRVLPVLVCAALGATSASADGLFSSNRMQFRQQTGVLEKRAYEEKRSKVRLAAPSVVTPTKWGPMGGDEAASQPVYRGAYNGAYADLARGAARRNGIPEDLFLRLVKQESNFNPRALSHKGAIGLAQLMPFTARQLGVDPHDPAQNLEGGARYLKQQYQAFGSWRLALAAYNAGPGAVVKHGGVPPYRETRNYVKTIWGS
ncbi:lytic transglycosylase [Salipiger pallidus]|uniref:Lytic transglycosylase n=1 Tax=Salipiger pallidus TaxID=1775170 RepID=A0A8J3EDA6_9RHOB|nr:lytic transglycosylase domain-containing protein [Salipiger pallidus]GGG58791.1 lytic transglycosylase [Salipiger pallidus]